MPFEHPNLLHSLTLFVPLPRVALPLLIAPKEAEPAPKPDEHMDEN